MPSQGAIPPARLPVVDASGNMHPAWFRFFASMVQPPQTPAAVTVGTSPFTYAAQGAGYVTISGGTVSSIKVVRGNLTQNVGASSGSYPLATGDKVIVTYSAKPAMAFFPN